MHNLKGVCVCVSVWLYAAHIDLELLITRSAVISYVKQLSHVENFI